MKSLKIAVSAAVALAGLALNLTPAAAKVEYTKKEKKPCTTCHTSMKSKDLNDTGKCYGEKKSLTECAPKKAAD